MPIKSAQVQKSVRYLYGTCSLRGNAQVIFQERKFLSSNCSRLLADDVPSHHDLQSSYANIVARSGFIEKKSGETLMYFDNIFPVRYSLWDPRYFLTRWFLSQDPDKLAKYIKSKSVPKGLLAEVEDFIPRAKDGGAIVKFKIQDGTAEDIAVKQIKDYVNTSAVRPWYNPFQFIRCFRIKGVPWIEDLHRFPSSRLRVEFEGPDLDEATLYSYFRRYGLIRDILPLSPSSKDFPRYATIQFVALRSATTARNCLHGLRAQNGTKLQIAYEATIQKHMFRDWIYNHPRIVLPAAAALLAAISVLVFDPIRTWFIKQKITGRFSFANNEFIKLIRNATQSTLNMIVSTGSFGHLTLLRREVADLQIGFSDRRDIVEQLHALLNTTPETFVVIQGPRGSGSVELVRDHAIKGRANTLVLDCEKLMDARSDGAFIKEITSQVGYFPVFPWMNNISGFIDLMVQGIIGQKAGFSESLETQFEKILENTASAIREIVVDLHRTAVRSSSKQTLEDELHDVTEGKRPVVVIEHFLHRSERNERNEAIYNCIAEWAALLVSTNLAHVIFITDDVTYSKTLTGALPNHVFNTITVGDVSPEHARQFVLRQILSVTGENEEDVDPQVLKDMDKAIEPLGGRMTDLLALARRITVAGETNLNAAEDMIHQSASEIIKRFLSASDDSRWTKEQAWVIIKALASKDNIRYNELSLNPLFKDGASVISALEQAELISVIQKNGRPNSIKAGRPIYRAAFQKLLDDKGLAALQELATYTSINKILEAGITKNEEELARLALIMSSKAAVADVSDRIKYLTYDIKLKQAKISENDKVMNSQKKILAVEY
ncbi:RNA12 protein-domain-containing protein [Lipomyces arxii]|uniref:RNA12 protein-domain-containing protein n=1 Tax=Lipomyces arxii TaxID=56418 RepID=UPI0034CF9CEF